MTNTPKQAPAKTEAEAAHDGQHTITLSGAVIGMVLTGIVMQVAATEQAIAAYDSMIANPPTLNPQVELNTERKAVAEATRAALIEAAEAIREQAEVYAPFPWEITEAIAETEGADVKGPAEDSRPPSASGPGAKSTGA